MDAVIGGTKITSLPGLTDLRVEQLETPYGPPSGPITIGRLAGNKIAFLPRHGDPHALAPHRINYRANLWALRELGVTQVVSIATVGGIRAEFGAGVLVVPDQIIDYTHGRDDTFHDGTDGEPVHHIDFTHPYSQALRLRLLAAAQAAGEVLFDGGCYGCCNGPRLETAAEVRRLAQDGCDLVGQTGMPEAALARELGLDYAAICPVVNPAAGLGDSKHEISRAELAATREAAVTRIIRILAVFAAQRD